MENKNMRKLNVTVQCMAVYNSSIMVPRELTFEEAIKYAKEHIDEINLQVSIGDYSRTGNQYPDAVLR